MNLFVTLSLHSNLNSAGILSRSIWYVSTSSLTGVTHVLKPNWRNLTSSFYTCFTIPSLGIWWRRFIQHIADTLQYILGGNIPHSPYTIILLVVALTLRTHLQKRNMTLSTIDVPFLLQHQTSLPYINIGFTTVLNNLNITFGGTGVIDRNLCTVPNKAFLPWSQKYG